MFTSLLHLIVFNNEHEGASCHLIFWWDIYEVSITTGWLLSNVHIKIVIFYAILHDFDVSQLCMSMLYYPASYLMNPLSCTACLLSHVFTNLWDNVVKFPRLNSKDFAS